LSQCAKLVNCSSGFSIHYTSISFIRRFDMFRYWRSRSAVSALFATLGLATGVALVPIVFAKSESKTEVEAVVLVVRRTPAASYSESSTSADDYLGAQLMLVRSPLVLNRALKNLGNADGLAA